MIPHGSVGLQSPRDFQPFFKTKAKASYGSFLASFWRGKCCFLGSFQKRCKPVPGWLLPHVSSPNKLNTLKAKALVLYPHLVSTVSQSWQDTDSKLASPQEKKGWPRAWTLKSLSLSPGYKGFLWLLGEQVKHIPMHPPLWILSPSTTVKTKDVPCLPKVQWPWVPSLRISFLLHVCKLPHHLFW